MSWDLLYLAFMFGMVGLAARDALLDRTPRKPFVWKRPDLEWWATRRTRRERVRTEIVMPEVPR